MLDLTTYLSGAPVASTRWFAALIKNRILVA